MRQTLKVDKMEKRTKTNGKKLPERIKKLLDFIKEGLVEKDEAIRLALLSAIAGESIFLLGSPGTAKSLISRRIKCAFKASEGKEVNYFEYLMNQFSTPDELFGPVSLKKLEQDSYERITDGYLPNAEVAFLDEIWKASPAIQNTLLTIINEKKYHNGTSVLQVPLKVLLSASNELPAENQGLEALWDRFLLRLLVDPIQNEDSFLALVCGKPVKSEVVPSPEMADVMISTKELEQWKNKIHAVSVPEDVQEVLASLRYKMRELDQKHPEKHIYYISDRRWTKIVNLLRTSAFLNGRNHVDLMDCYLISYCIWNDDSVIEKVRELVGESIREDGHDFFKEIEEIQHQINGKNTDSFDAFVMNNFYEDTEAKPKLYEMPDGNYAFKIVSPQKIKISSYQECTPYYVSPYEVWDYYSRKEGAYYDDKMKRIDSNCIRKESFKMKGNTITWEDNRSYNSQPISAKIEMTPSMKIKSPKLFGYNKRIPKLYKMKDGTTAYKIKKPTEIRSFNMITPYYISPDYQYIDLPYGRDVNEYQGAYFDQYGGIIGNYNYRIKKNSFHFLDVVIDKDEDVVGWIDGCSGAEFIARIELQPMEWVKGNAKKLADLKEKAQQKYDTLRSSIDATGDKINKYLKGKRAQYQNNLFVDSKIGELIITEVKQAKDDLDVALEELEKVKFKYSDSDETR